MSKARTESPRAHYARNGNFDIAQTSVIEVSSEKEMKFSKSLRVREKERDAGGENRKERARSRFSL